MQRETGLGFATRSISVRDANRSFSKPIVEVEAGETALITQNGRPVAQVRPQSLDPMDDPSWQAAYEAVLASLRAAPRTGFRLGATTAVDKYGDKG